MDLSTMTNEAEAPEVESGPKVHSFSELETIFVDAKSCDQEVFSEMRSNLLLIGGEHYNRRNSLFHKHIRDAKELSDQQKLRLTKNHVQKIVKTYCNNIISQAPGVGFEPKNETELQDQKAAELHHAVWQDARDRYNLDEHIDDWCDDFVGVGEVAVKIFFDPSGGDHLGYEQETDAEGTPQVDAMGQPVASNVAVYTGEFVFERVFGFNLLRPSECKNINKAEVLIIQKMANIDRLKARFADFADKINASQDKTFLVFDYSRGGYRKANTESMVREFYFRPCPRYPKGYYFICTDDLILDSNELPGGIYPLIVQPFDKIQTTPRGRGPVKTMRPYQAEINRAASKIAEHHITLGDDKLIVPYGRKVSSGNALPGVRSINIDGGGEIKVLSGRDGSQFLGYMQAQIQELYQVMNVAEDTAPADNSQMDPYALLFKSASQKKHFQRYVKRFERFLILVARTYIRLAKIHLPDEQVIMAIGRNERINIPEFRSTSEGGFEVKVTPQSDDIETKLGKQLVLNHLVQYTGGKLDKEDLGKLVRLMPYANLGEGFSDLTLDYDSATNDILALDRGEQPPINQYDNHIYMIKRLVTRVRQPDFKYLDPQIQGNYAQRIQAHEEADAQQKQAIQAAEAGFIPTGGYMVTCDLYVTDPTSPNGNTRRARIPYDAVTWLIQKLQTQGQSLDQLEQVNQGALSQMAQMMLQKQQGAGQAQGPAQAPPPGAGAAMPRR